MFDDDLLKKGAEGGAEAAYRLQFQIKEYIKDTYPETTIEDWSIIVQVGQYLQLPKVKTDDRHLPPLTVMQSLILKALLENYMRRELFQIPRKTLLSLHLDAPLAARSLSSASSMLALARNRLIIRSER